MGRARGTLTGRYGGRCEPHSTQPAKRAAVEPSFAGDRPGAREIPQGRCQRLSGQRPAGEPAAGRGAGLVLSWGSYTGAGERGEGQRTHNGGASPILTATSPQFRVLR